MVTDSIGFASTTLNRQPDEADMTSTAKLLKNPDLYGGYFGLYQIYASC